MIEVGEYVRTNGGNIYQIRKIEKSISAIGQTIYWVKEFYLLKEDIKAHSKNIIDLIEVGDYVNGVYINLIMKDEGNVYHDAYDMYDCQAFGNEDIKTILTHEQYKQNCYKVGED